MKKSLKKLLVVLLIFAANITFVTAQVLPSAKLQSNPWTKDQLMQPATLAKMINGDQKLRIYNIGVVQNIKGAVHIGAGSEKKNLEKLRTTIKSVPKNETVVLYCGCCPMDKCPNIRPAFQILKDQKFQRAFLLNIPVNLKTDWIDKGYPLAQP